MLVLEAEDVEGSFECFFPGTEEPDLSLAILNVVLEVYLHVNLGMVLYLWSISSSMKFSFPVCVEFTYSGDAGS